MRYSQGRATHALLSGTCQQYVAQGAHANKMLRRGVQPNAVKPHTPVFVGWQGVARSEPCDGRAGA